MPLPSRPRGFVANASSRSTRAHAGAPPHARVVRAAARRPRRTLGAPSRSARPISSGFFPVRTGAQQLRRMECARGARSGPKPSRGGHFLTQIGKKRHDSREFDDPHLARWERCAPLCGPATEPGQAPRKERGDAIPRSPDLRTSVWGLTFLLSSCLRAFVVKTLPMQSSLMPRSLDASIPAGRTPGVMRIVGGDQHAGA